MRLDPVAIFVNSETLIIGLALTVAVLVTKFLAAWITSRIYNYSQDQMLTAWGLSQAQAAATLATILVATEAKIFPETIFNASFLMIIVTSISSPIIVERFGKRLKPPDEKDEKRPLFKRIMVPVLGDNSPEDVLELGGLLARVGDGNLLVMSRAARDLTLKKRREKLKSEVLRDPETEVDLHHRIEKINPEGILRIKSKRSILDLLDWTQGNRSEGRIFDELVDGVIWGAKTPVIAVRLR